jgi:hypothetical protein
MAPSTSLSLYFKHNVQIGRLDLWFLYVMLRIYQVYMQMKMFYSEKARLVTLCELPSVQKKLVAGAVITSVL